MKKGRSVDRYIGVVGKQIGWERTWEVQTVLAGSTACYTGFVCFSPPDIWTAVAVVEVGFPRSVSSV